MKGAAPRLRQSQCWKPLEGQMRGRLTASRGKAGLLRGRAGDRQRRPADLPAGEFDRNRPRRASVDRGAN